MKEYFGYSLYSYYDMEKDLVDSEVDIMHAVVDLLKLSTLQSAVLWLRS